MNSKTAAAWCLLSCCLLALGWHLARFDFRTNRLVGDQASFLLQSLSLAYAGHDLRFDDADLARWREVGWTRHPHGLFFRVNHAGLAFAKPYGYSLALAPFVRVFGAVRGVPVANGLLLLAALAASALTLSSRRAGWVIPVLLVGFYFAAPTYFYAFVIHPEIFYVTLAAVFWTSLAWYRTRGATAALFVATAVLAVTVAEKPPFALFAIPLAVALWPRATRLERGRLALVGSLGFLVASLPYLYYSDFSTLSPYGGNRYMTPALLPLDLDLLHAHATPADQSRVMSFAHVVHGLFGPLADRAASFFYYVVGAHTGLLPFHPLALFLIVATIWHWRDTDWLCRSALVGTLLYVSFYVMLFTDNYYGGGQSLGNRYFVQVSPALLVLAANEAISQRVLSILAATSIGISLIALWPHHTSPQDAFSRLDRQSSFQRLLPLERNQRHVNYFICGQATCR